MQQARPQDATSATPASQVQSVCPLCAGSQYHIKHVESCSNIQYEGPVTPSWSPEYSCEKCDAKAEPCTECKGQRYVPLQRTWTGTDLSVPDLFLWLQAQPIRRYYDGSVGQYQAKQIANEFGFVNMVNLAYPGAELVPGTIILDDYGDEDNMGDRVPDNWTAYATLCLHHWTVEHSWFETGLVCVHRETEELKLLGHQHAESPMPLPKDLGGKRAFYVYQKGFPIYYEWPKSGKFKGKRRPVKFAETDILSLRVDEDVDKTFPAEFRQPGSGDWVSGPRVLLPLQTISES